MNTGSDIEKLVNNPDFQNELIAPITMNDFNDSMKNISKSVGKEDLKEYEKWSQEFSSI